MDVDVHALDGALADPRRLLGLGGELLEGISIAASPPSTRGGWWKAAEAGDHETAVTAHRDLGFVEVQAGRRQTAAAWLAKAEKLAETDDELTSILGVCGMNASDMGDYPAAIQHLQAFIEQARRCDNQRQEAWSLSIGCPGALPRAGARGPLGGIPAMAASAHGGARPAGRPRRPRHR
jgi:tetratricopeptide (TPR) repeat protein